MKQQEFESEHELLWLQIDKALEKPAREDNPQLLAEHYLSLCQHLAIAKERMYDSALVERLNKRALGLYRELYRYRAETRLNFYAFFKRDFPLAIYRHRFYILVALLVMVLPGLVGGVWSYFDDEAIYSVLDGSQVRHMERIYDPEAGKIGREREADTDLYMFGYYIMNNISVAFRCFDVAGQLEDPVLHRDRLQLLLVRLGVVHVALLAPRLLLLADIAEPTSWLALG